MCLIAKPRRSRTRRSLRLGLAHDTACTIHSTRESPWSIAYRLAREARDISTPSPPPSICASSIRNCSESALKDPRRVAEPTRKTIGSPQQDKVIDFLLRQIQNLFVSESFKKNLSLRCARIHGPHFRLHRTPSLVCSIKIPAAVSSARMASDTAKLLDLRAVSMSATF